MRFGGYIIGLRQALFPCRPLGQTARSGGCSAQVMEAHIQKNVFVIVFGFGSVTSMLQKSPPQPHLHAVWAPLSRTKAPPA